mmetsp:Transcript_11409/g.18934  ORF Transcript_11409/g.18934 Transcript_11409/m.18934 type:complete len:162 (-) Transcript_11409:288-773(-)|eukprot:CAMPEP_0119002990 /NCGR_PEP_ID=MMETSP1176-20130426/282_1 /TAXON_ID=265551 /ORGANISM="Synedropsis recta cf, Strain CCMP1620" /LENGTH=161 /DNA_ID=CAMNT_0006954539 /DNA_START=41 /DNA_END=526 /DNA_ORIENTATION=+
MGEERKERRSNRPRIIMQGIMERRSKKRAPSFDGTIDTSSSSIDHSRQHTPSNSQHHPSRYPAAIIAIEEEDSRNHVPFYKSEVALSNRFSALNAQQEMLGENHPDVLFSLQNLATLHYRRGNIVEAQRLLEDYQGRRERAFSDQHSAMKVPTEIFCTEPV